MCGVEGCESKVVARGLCKAHLHKLYAYGDATAGRRRTDRYSKGHINQDGYRVINDGDKKKPEHILIAERAIGGPLPPGAVVHHVDENRANNANDNLVVCPSRAYHNLLHQRMRARDACGNPNWRKCCRCLVYDDPQNLNFSGGQAYHAACNSQHVKRMKEKKK